MNIDAVVKSFLRRLNREGIEVEPDDTGCGAEYTGKAMTWEDGTPVEEAQLEKIFNGEGDFPSGIIHFDTTFSVSRISKEQLQKNLAEQKKVNQAKDLVRDGKVKEAMELMEISNPLLLALKLMFD